MTLPLARHDDLLVEEVNDEIVVFDLAADRAHCLSRTSGLVWKECDGTRSPEEIASRVGVSEDVVTVAMDQLQDAGLLVVADESAPGSVTRRQLIRGLGAAAAFGVLLPSIHSVAVPGVAVAQTDGCCPSASLIGDTVGTRFAGGTIVNRVVGAGIELPNAGPTLGAAGPSPRWNIDFGVNTIRIDFLQQPATYGAGASFTFSSLNPRVPAGCSPDLVPKVVAVQVFTNKLNAGYVTASFTADTVTVNIAPANAGVDWLPGEFILLRLTYACDQIIVSTGDPCCPPWNSQKLGEMMVYQGTGGISAPFTLRFQPTATLNTQMRAYIAYLNTVNPAINSLVVTFRLLDAGTGSTCVPGAQVPSTSSVAETWTPPLSALPPVPAPNFFPAGVMVVNHWYQVQTVTSLNNGLTFFPASCANSNICVRLQVFSLSEGSTGPRAVLQIRLPDGSVVNRPLA